MDALYTRADYDRLPEGFPAQLIEGFLVKEPSPTYRQARLKGRVLARLADHVGPDRALPAPADVGLDEHNVYQPDIVVVRDIPDDASSDVGIPLLAVEVFSPTSRKRDREVKTRHLLAAGVEEVWLVDGEHATLEVHRPDGVQVARGDTELSSRALPGFTLVPEELFRPPARS